LELELELLVVSSFVIQRQISPFGIGIVSCALLHNTKTNLWWGVWKPIFLFKHGEPMDLRKKFLEKRETDEKVEEEREKEKLCMSKHRLSEEGNPISSGIDVVVVSPPSPEAKRKSSLEINPSSISSRQLCCG
jgi:hypothetical protein